MRKKDTVRVSFEMMRLNYDRLQEYERLFPQMDLHRKDKIDWDEMIALELHLASHYQSLFDSKNHDYLFGKKSVTWQQIKEKLLKLYRAQDKAWQEKFKKNRDRYDSEEHTGIKDVIVKLESVKSEDSFREMLEDYSDYRTWDTDCFYQILDLIFNYAANHNVKVDTAMLQDEFVVELEPPQKDRVEKLAKERKQYNAALDEAAKLIAPHIVKAHKKDKHCGVTNFYSDLKRRASKLSKINYNG